MLVRWLIPFALCLTTPAAEVNGIVVTGLDTPSMSSFDRIITALMRKYNVPGGQVAVAKDGRIVFSHGYGMSDREQRQPLQPNSLFRIASLSQPCTSAAMLQLVVDGTV